MIAKYIDFSINHTLETQADRYWFVAENKLTVRFITWLFTQKYVVTYGRNYAEFF